MNIKMPYNDYVKLMYFKENIASKTGISYTDFKSRLSSVTTFKRNNYDISTFYPRNVKVNNTLHFDAPASVPPSTPFMSSSELSRLGIALLSGNSLLLLIISLNANIMSSFGNIYGASIRAGDLDTFVNVVNSMDGAIFWPSMVNNIFQFFTNLFNWVFEYLLRFLNWFVSLFM